MLFLAAFLILPGKALAVKSISVTDFADGDRLFHNDNIYPGYSEDHSISIENTSTEGETLDVFFRFNITNNSDLTQKLNLYVLRGTRYQLGGAGDRITLDEADDAGPLFIDRLDPGEKQTYKIKIKFNEDADNDYQGLSAEFDIDFGYETQVTTPTSPLPLGGRTVTGNPPVVEGVVSEGEQGQEGQEGQLAGEESRCQGWPQWIWILSFIVFVSVILADAWKNYKKEKYGWKFALVWTLAAVAFWYFFDKCREFQWFFHYSIIIAFVIHFAYLSLLRKKLEKYKVKKEGE